MHATNKLNAGKKRGEKETDGIEEGENINEQLGGETELETCEGTHVSVSQGSQD